MAERMMSKWNNNKFIDHISQTHAVLFFAIMGLVLCFINPSWLFNRYGVPDLWGYFGLAYQFAPLAKAFPDCAAVDLLALNLPSAALYQLFPPLVAKFLITYVSYVLVLSLSFSVISRLVTKRAAIFASLLFLQYQFFMSAIGADYTEGRVMLYLSIVLYFITHATDDFRLKKVYLYLAGLFYFFMVDTTVLASVYLLPLFLFYLIKNQHFEKLKRRAYREVAIDYLTFLSGTVSSYLLIWLLSVIFSNKKPPLLSAFEKLFGFLGGVFHSPPMRDWLSGATWLILFVSVLLVLTFYYYKKIRSHTTYTLSHNVKASCLLFVSMAAILILIQVGLNQWSLQLLYHHQVLPVVILGLAVVIHEPLERLNRKEFLVVCCLLVILALVTHFIHENWGPTVQDFYNIKGINFLPEGRPRRLFSRGLLLVFFLMGLLFFEVMQRRKILGITLFVISFALVNIFGSPNGFPRGVGSDYEVRNLGIGLASSKDNFLATVKWCDLQDRLDPKRQARIWYNLNKKYGHLIQQFSSPSYLYQESLLNKKFPNVHPGAFSRIDSTGVEPKSGMRVLIVSELESPEVLAASELQRVNLRLKVDRKEYYQHNTIRLSVVLATLL